MLHHMVIGHDVSTRIDDHPRSHSPVDRSIRIPLLRSLTREKISKKIIIEKIPKWITTFSFSLGSSSHRTGSNFHIDLNYRWRYFTGSGSKSRGTAFPSSSSVYKTLLTGGFSSS